MLGYRVDPMWGQTCSAYHVQYRFPTSALAQISAIQDSLEQTIAGLQRVPLTAVHMTVVTLLHPETGPEADAIWRQYGTQWTDSIEQVCASAAPVRLALDTVKAFDTAIVLMTRQCETLQRLREKLVAGLAPSVAARVPQIGHASLFRYANLQAAGHESLSTLEHDVAAVDLEIAEVLLVRETRYPSLEAEVLRRLRLSA
jgi:hypothetical protein